MDASGALVGIKNGTPPSFAWMGRIVGKGPCMAVHISSTFKMTRRLRSGPDFDEESSPLRLWPADDALAVGVVV